MPSSSATGRPHAPSLGRIRGGLYAVPGTPSAEPEDAGEGAGARSPTMTAQLSAYRRVRLAVRSMSSCSTLRAVLIFFLYLFVSVRQTLQERHE